MPWKAFETELETLPGFTQQQSAPGKTDLGGFTPTEQRTLARQETAPGKTDLGGQTPTEMRDAFSVQQPAPGKTDLGGLTPTEQLPQSTFEVFKESGQRGLQEGFTSAKQGLTDPFADLKPKAPERDYTGRLLSQPISEGWNDPNWWVAHITRGTAASAPSLATGIAGGAVGGALGGPGGAVAGTAGGFGFGSIMQSIAPAYQQARAKGLEHEAAVDEALKASEIAGWWGMAMGAAPGVPLFGKTAEGVLRRPISEALAQIFGVQPALVAGSVADRTMQIDKRLPTADELGTAAAEAAGVGATLVGGQAAARAGGRVARNLYDRAMRPGETPVEVLPPEARPEEPISFIDLIPDAEGVYGGTAGRQEALGVTRGLLEPPRGDIPQGGPEGAPPPPAAPPRQPGGGQDTFAARQDFAQRIKEAQEPGPVRTEGTTRSDVNQMRRDFAFAGPKAKTANLTKLEEAKKLATKEADPIDIWQETGWFQGNDGTWQFELTQPIKVNEAKIKIKPNRNWGVTNKNLIQYRGSLSNLLNAPELIDAYPFLKKIKVTTNQTEGSHFNLENKTINILPIDGKTGESKTLQEILSELEHEIQHAIQLEEGFALGGTADTAGQTLEKALSNVNKQLRDVASSGSNIRPHLLDLRDKIIHSMDTLNRWRSGGHFRPEHKEAYDRLIGEVQAENARLRGLMTEEERKQSFPRSTETVPPEEQFAPTDIISLTPKNSELIKQVIDQNYSEIKDIEGHQLIGIIDDNSYDMFNKEEFIKSIEREGLNSIIKKLKNDIAKEGRGTHPRYRKTYIDNRKKLLEFSNKLLKEHPILGPKPGYTVNQLDTEKLIDTPDDQSGLQEKIETTPLQDFAFAGPKAKGADLKKLNQARVLEQQNTDPVQIWQETGWFKKPDGDWKFELTKDFSLTEFPRKLNENVSQLLGRGKTYIGSLKHFVNAPELFENYPQLRDVLITTKKGGGNGLHIYPNGEFSIQIDTHKKDGTPRTNQEIISSLSHEIQHGIQEIEGFSGGGHPDTMTEPLEKASKSVNKKIKENPDDASLKELKGRISTALERFKSNKDARLAAYQHLFGEAESENAALRTGMSATQREESFPLSTELREQADQFKPNELIDAIPNEDGSYSFVRLDPDNRLGLADKDLWRRKSAQQDQAITTAPLQGFYSPVQRYVENAKHKKAPAGQWANQLNKGAPGREAKALGLDLWLEEKGKGEAVTADEITDWLKAHEVEIEQKTFSHNDRKMPEARVKPMAGRYTETLLKPKGLEYTSPHFDENEVVIITTTDRAGPKDENYGALEHVQSDLHQKGRERGYQNPVKYKEAQQIRNKINKLDEDFNDKQSTLLNFINATAPSNLGHWELVDIFNQIKLLNDGKKPEFTLAPEKQGIVKDLMSNPKFMGLLNDLEEFYKNQYSQREELEQQFAEAKPELAKVPEAPFKDDLWWQLGVKWAIGDAIQKGQDGLILPTPKQMAQASGGSVETLKTLYGTKIPSWTKKYVKSLGGVITREPIPDFLSEDAPSKNREDVRFVNDFDEGFNDLINALTEYGVDYSKSPAWRSKGLMALELADDLQKSKEEHEFFGAQDSFEFDTKAYVKKIYYDGYGGYSFRDELTKGFHKKDGSWRAPVLEEPGYQVIKFTPEMRENIAQSGQPLFAAEGSGPAPSTAPNPFKQLMGKFSPGSNVPNDLTGQELANFIRDKVHRGITVNVSSRVRDYWLNIADSLGPLIPKDIPVNALARIDVMKGENVKATFKDKTGQETVVYAPINELLSVRAWHQSDGFGNSALFFLPFNVVGQVDQRIKGQLWHEATHALRRNGYFPDTVWSRLISHAELLNLPNIEYREYARLINEPNWQEMPDGVTISDIYTRLYRGDPALEDRIQEEYVTHMLELKEAGVLTEEQLAPIQDIIDAMAGGQYEKGTSVLDQPGVDYAIDFMNSVSVEPVTLSDYEEFIKLDEVFKSIDKYTFDNLIESVDVVKNHEYTIGYITNNKSGNKLYLEQGGSSYSPLSEETLSDLFGYNADFAKVVIAKANQAETTQPKSIQKTSVYDFDKYVYSDLPTLQQYIKAFQSVGQSDFDKILDIKNIKVDGLTIGFALKFPETTILLDIKGGSHLFNTAGLEAAKPDISTDAIRQILGAVDDEPVPQKSNIDLIDEVMEETRHQYDIPSSITDKITEQLFDEDNIHALLEKEVEAKELSLAEASYLLTALSDSMKLLGKHYESAADHYAEDLLKEALKTSDKYQKVENYLESVPPELGLTTPIKDVFSSPYTLKLFSSAQFKNGDVISAGLNVIDNHSYWTQEQTPYVNEIKKILKGESSLPASEIAKANLPVPEGHNPPEFKDAQAARKSLSPLALDLFDSLNTPKYLKNYDNVHPNIGLSNAIKDYLDNYGKHISLGVVKQLEKVARGLVPQPKSGSEIIDKTDVADVIPMAAAEPKISTVKEAAELLSTNGKVHLAAIINDVTPLDVKIDHPTALESYDIFDKTWNTPIAEGIDKYVSDLNNGIASSVEKDLLRIAKDLRSTSSLSFSEMLKEQRKDPQKRHYTFVGKASGGTKPKELWTDQDGKEYMFKPVKAGDEFLAYSEALGGQISKFINPKGPEIFTINLDGRFGSMQEYLPNEGTLRENNIKVDNLTVDQVRDLQREQIIDWLISNHDSHDNQFLLQEDGSLVGIDKGQAFKYLGRDKLTTDYHPNEKYGEKEPIYNTIWRTYKQGGLKRFREEIEQDEKADVSSIKAQLDEIIPDLEKSQNEYKGNQDKVREFRSSVLKEINNLFGNLLINNKEDWRNIELGLYNIKDNLKKQPLEPDQYYIPNNLINQAYEGGGYTLTRPTPLTKIELGYWDFDATQKYGNSGHYGGLTLVKADLKNAAREDDIIDSVYDIYDPDAFEEDPPSLFQMLVYGLKPEAKHDAVFDSKILELSDDLVKRGFDHAIIKHPITDEEITIVLPTPLEKSPLTRSDRYDDVSLERAKIELQDQFTTLADKIISDTQKEVLPLFKKEEMKQIIKEHLETRKDILLSDWNKRINAEIQDVFNFSHDISVDAVLSVLNNEVYSTVVHSLDPVIRDHYLNLEQPIPSITSESQDALHTHILNLTAKQEQLQKELKDANKRLRDALYREVTGTINKIQLNLDDQTYLDLLKPYAESYFKGNEIRMQAFLDFALQRKNRLGEKFYWFYLNLDDLRERARSAMGEYHSGTGGKVTESNRANFKSLKKNYPKTFANPELINQLGELTDAEMLAIEDYTNSAFTTINRRLRAEPPIKEGELNLEWMKGAEYAALITSGLEKMPPHNGRVYRRETKNNQQQIDDLRIGSIYSNKQFMSSTTNYLQEGSYEILYVIESQTGRWVKEISGHPSENEVLIPPHRQFLITNVVITKGKYGGENYTVYMEELPEIDFSQLN